MGKLIRVGSMFLMPLLCAYMFMDKIVGLVSVFGGLEEFCISGQY